VCTEKVIPESMNTKKIRIENLTKIFGSRRKEALELLKRGASKDDILEKTGCGVGVNNASFEVAEGEIVVVMGLSGSGKSTLIRCVNRLIKPTAGKVYIDDVEVTGLNDQELRKLRLTKLAMVFQNFALFPHRTVCRNVEYGLEIQGVEAETRRERAMKAIEQVGLKGWEDYRPENLSGGMQQRVGLARALALDPDILLMDEAFSALDPLIRSDMQDELISLQESMHKTILFVSHDLDEALKIGDRIVLMKDGAIVQMGTAEEILTHPADDYVERFVENVDITKVLTAESVMIKAKAVAYLDLHGPKTVLKMMKKERLSQLFVVNGRHEVVGLVTADDASEAINQGETNLGAFMKKEFLSVSPETPATELIQIMADTPYPLPVVNDEGRLKGVIIRGALLAALAERGKNNADS
jgi:glycine betaine/proline transport system ATP-binding protein